ncbi:MAG: hypothetical protein HY820_33400 [Acidobacteria bacterium]|nr:hypothetical protein [Acidobacteriota bacterium]
MSSQRRIESSRANGRLSRGPITEDGKQRSSHNGIRHGMLASSVVLEGESIDRFTALIEALEAEYEPATPTEYTLVETMAVARWMQMRAWGFAKAEFDLEMARQDPAIGQRPLRAASTFRNLIESGSAYDKAHRYAISHATQFNRALVRLTDIQSNRRNSIPLPEVTGNLANSTWESDAPEPLLQDEPSPISEQQNESETEAA